MLQVPFKRQTAQQIVKGLEKKKTDCVAKREKRRDMANVRHVGNAGCRFAAKGMVGGGGGDVERTIQILCTACRRGCVCTRKIDLGT